MSSTPNLSIVPSESPEDARYRAGLPHRLPPCEFRRPDGKCLIVDKTTTIKYPRTTVMYKSPARCRDAIVAEACKEGWA